MPDNEVGTTFSESFYRVAVYNDLQKYFFLKTERKISRKVGIMEKHPILTLIQVKIGCLKGICRIIPTSVFAISYPYAVVGRFSIYQETV